MTEKLDTKIIPIRNNFSDEERIETVVRQGSSTKVISRRAS